MPRILLIDDNPDYCRQFVDEARFFGFDAGFFHNLEEGFEALMASRRYLAVVLDGHCMLEPGQHLAAKPNFVFHALHRLRELEHDFNRVIPCCVNTEKPADFIDELEGLVTVFHKGKQHAELFGWLLQAVNHLPETVVRTQYSDIFSTVEGLLNEEEQEMLADVLMLNGSASAPDIDNGLAMLRKLLELLMDIACLKHLGKQPSAFMKGHGSRTRRIMEALNKKVLPGELYKSAHSLYTACSRYGSHTERLLHTEPVAWRPGKYTYSRMLSAYLELLVFLLAA